MPWSGLLTPNAGTRCYCRGKCNKCGTVKPGGGGGGAGRGRGRGDGGGRGRGRGRDGTEAVPQGPPGEWLRALGSLSFVPTSCFMPPISTMLLLDRRRFSLILQTN